MSIFEDIQDRLSIIEVIEEYTTVYDRGNYFVSLCPFHQERRPSMSISKDKGVFYCFGCMESGNMFSFVSKIENISKKEALEKLAHKAGVTLDRNTNTELDNGYKLLHTAMLIYNQALNIYLRTPNYVNSYIASRKLTSLTLETFQLGYAPKDNIILNFMKSKDIDLSLGLATGLLIERNGVIKDKFSDRLVIPITNDYGKVIGFTARNFPNDTLDRPKYLNSPESQFFNKSKLLFALDISKKNIQEKKQVILVEGNMDAITAHQYGLNYTIATQGTATTVEHIRKLKKLNVELVLAFDNDNAGRTAELKVFKMAIENDIPTFKLIIPDTYKDIDEYLQLNSIDNLNIVSYLQYFINNQTNLNNPDLYTQKNAINYVLNTVLQADPVIQAQTASLLHKVTNLDIATIKNSRRVQYTNPAPSVLQPIINPIKLSFYQILSIDSGNPALPIIYDLIKEYLDQTLPTFAEYINQEEIQWVITSQKNQYSDIQLDISMVITNLIHLIKRHHPNHPKLRELVTYINH
jgi:DNA primase